MTRYKVTAELTYYVDAPDEDAVYQEADDMFVDAEAPEVYVRTVVEVSA